MGHPLDDSSAKSQSDMRILCHRASTWDLDVLRTFTDERGIFCVKIDTRYEPVYCIVKGYRYQDRASFPRKVVRRAASEHGLLGIFFSDGILLGNGYVFLADTVFNEGVENRGGSDMDDQKIWVDIELDYGVVFGDYITGRETPY